MKIIGETKDGKIAEISNDELANLLGYYGKYSKDCGVQSLEIGSEIKINEMFQQLYRIAAIKGTIKEMERSANQLLECIRIKTPVIEPIMSAIESKMQKT